MYSCRLEIILTNVSFFVLIELTAKQQRDAVNWNMVRNVIIVCGVPLLGEETAQAQCEAIGLFVLRVWGPHLVLVCVAAGVVMNGSVGCPVRRL